MKVLESGRRIKAHALSACITSAPQSRPESVRDRLGDVPGYASATAERSLVFVDVIVCFALLSSLMRRFPFPLFLFFALLAPRSVFHGLSVFLHLNAVKKIGVVDSLIVSYALLELSF